MAIVPESLGIELSTDGEGAVFAAALESLIHAADDLSMFVAAAEAVLIDLVEADAAAYADIDFSRWSFRARWSEDRSDFAALMGRYHRLMGRKTVWTGSRSGAPQQFSDFMDDRTLYDTAVYSDVLRPLSINRGAVFGFPASAHVGVNFGLYRQSRAPYPPAALARLKRIRPTLSQLYGLSLVRTWSRLSPADKLDRLDLPLTAKQRQVAKLLLQGFTSEEVARALGISGETSRNHVRAIYQRLAVQNRVDLTLALTSDPPATLPVSACVSAGP